MTIRERLAFAFFVLGVMAILALIIFSIIDSRRQIEECSARGGVVVRDLGCVDLKKIRP